MQISLHKLAVIVFSSTLLMAFQNCSDMSFRSMQKSETLAKHQVFPTDNGSDNNRTPSSTAEDGSHQSDGSDENPNTTDIDIIEVERMCSDARTSSREDSNVINSKTLKLVIHEYGSDMIPHLLEGTANPTHETIRCTISDTKSLRQQLLAGKLNIQSCNLSSSSNSFYRLEILNDKGQDLVSDQRLNYKRIELKDLSGEKFSYELNGLSGFSEVQVITDYNREDDESVTHCDKNASPLYVDFRNDYSDIDILTSPEDGVLFDILGANGQPAYSKNQISWFKDSQFGLLALPDRDGYVAGIDQLFGDNTLGPDNNFSDNGFTALAKHDDNKDNKIDANDAVYSKLRLWFDRNSDAIAQNHELEALPQRGLTSIDLEYDENYREVDKYGNEIKYKSVVDMIDGEMKAIFDVWFKL